MSKHEFDSQSVEIERAAADDAEIICDIRDKAWLEAYPNAELGITRRDIKRNAQGLNGEFVPKRVAYMKEQFTSQKNGLTTYVARQNKTVVGYVSPSIDGQSRPSIGALYVAPEKQGMGIGTRLMEHALGLLGQDEDIFLEVVSYNNRAIQFYERFGFVKTDTLVLEEENRPAFMKPLPQIETVRRAVKS
ncbi:hypothetical protein BH23PAT2_BH23PAT2_05180 [soil metagenome]